MSLEQQVTALVEASNNLTTAVNGKIQEIDRKVDEATADVPAAVVSTMNKEIYIDALNGSDSNTGKQNQPVRTVNQALRMVPSGARGLLYLKMDQIHEVVKDGVSGSEKNLLISCWYATGANKPILRAMPSSFGAPNCQISAVFESQSRISVKFMDIEIQTGKVTDNNTNFPYGGSVESKSNLGYGGFFSRGGGQNESCHFDVQFIGCVIRLQDFRLFTFYYGSSIITIARTSVFKEGANSSLCDSDVPKVIDISDVSFSGFDAGETIKALFKLTDSNHIIRENTALDYDTGVSKPL